MKRHRLQPKDYTVGWISALPIELAAATNLLDEEHENIPLSKQDPTSYTLGRIGAHNIVLACLPAGQIGTHAAATVASRMRATFTSIQYGLMVGIGGGVPSKFDVRLGDVVVSQPDGEYGGVVQHDFGKTGVHGRITRTGFLNGPPEVLLQTISRVRANHLQGRIDFLNYISAFQNRPVAPDILFEAGYNHKGEEKTCSSCTEIIERPTRIGQEIAVHYGTIASGNQVIKDGVTRDRISEELGDVLCFEMEGAGLMNSFPCLVIRGICDYADSHKNDHWQPFAAATAASFAKEVLSVLPAIDGRQRPGCEELHEDESYQKMRSALLLTDPSKELSKIVLAKDDRVPGTCEWILGQEKYAAWSDGDRHQVLRLVGAPGVGKTMLSVFLVDKLKKPDRTIAYYFCDNKDRRRKTGEAILQGVLFQLLQKRSIFELVKEHYKQTEKSLHDLHALWGLFKKTLEKYDAGKVYLIIDALDECDKLSLEKFVRLLRHDIGKMKAKILITCRNEPRIEDALRDHADRLDIVPKNVKADISKYIQYKVDRLEYAQDLKEEISARLSKQAEDTFLWVSLVLLQLSNAESTDESIRKTLKALPRGLDEVYDGILSQIQRSQADRAKFVLQWVAVARRPLTVDELDSAYALWSGKRITNAYKCCEPLVQVDENKTVNLVHQSAKDFLLSVDSYFTITVLRCVALSTILWVGFEGRYVAAFFLLAFGLVSTMPMESFSSPCRFYDALLDIPNQIIISPRIRVDPFKANLFIFQICWKYLGMKVPKTGPKKVLYNKGTGSMPVVGVEGPLQKYAADEWLEHALAATPASITEVISASDDLDKSPTLRDSWLLAAARDGQKAVVQVLLEKGANVEAMNDDGLTALLVAARNLQDNVVQLILKTKPDISPDLVA
ncbi:hypothetical protein GQ44DRAFT_828125 [Phaeosphaeriaceae sp. PMI808]|nr:hypothetical protein GQ44DRAFT_828125 [Phaeosphaeriaceae sp. PMI808]